MDRPDSDEDALTGFHRFLRMESEASPATCRRRIVTLKAFLKWRAKRDRGLVSDFSQLDLDLRVPRRLPRPIERQTLTKLLAATPCIVPRSPEVHRQREPADHPAARRHGDDERDARQRHGRARAYRGHRAEPLDDPVSGEPQRDHRDAERREAERGWPG